MTQTKNSLENPGRFTGSLRGYIARNSIALLSNYRSDGIDPPFNDWLGRFSNREKVRRSGLWNSNDVDEPYAPAFLGVLMRLVETNAQNGSAETITVRVTQSHRK